MKPLDIVLILSWAQIEEDQFKMFPLQQVLYKQPKSLFGKLSYHWIFIFVIFQSDHEWNRNLRLLFNTKARTLDNFSRDNFPKQSKQLTRLLFIYYFQPCYYITSTHASSTFRNNLNLCTLKVLWLFSTITKKGFHGYAFLSISNSLLSHHYPHILWSFREAGSFTSSFSQFCLIN